MMKQFDIDKAIYEKYIVPTKHKTGYMIGIEFEIPILNMSQEKIDFSVIQKVVLALREAFDLNIEKRDDNGLAWAKIPYDSASFRVLCGASTI